MQSLIPFPSHDPPELEWDYDSMTLTDFLSEGWLKYLEDLYMEGRQTKVNIELEKFSQTAARVGFKSGVKKFWEDYRDERGQSIKEAGSDLMTEFPGQDFALRSGKWTCDDRGIRTNDYRFGEIVACAHPIMPVERVVNVDTGSETIRLAYKRPDMKGWNKQLIVPKSTLASPQKIIELSDKGVSVTSQNAKAMIEYLQDVENMNYDIVKLKRSTARLGWINDQEFSPYTGGLEFDHASALRRQYDSVDQEGDFIAWRKLVQELRERDIVFKIMTAASYASAILYLIDALPAFVHVWTDQSSTGKTIALMVAASIWGDPAIGSYVQSYNATTVAMERLAEFYNSMPLVLDELQQAKDDKGRGGINVYRLAQGSGKSRSNRQGGLEKLPTWNNFILSSGETPLVDQSDGAGALARVINIELDKPLVDGEEGNDIARLLKNNHGHAGRMFIDALMKLDKKTITDMYEANYKTLLQDKNIQDKQGMSAAAIVTGDMLASQFVTGDAPLTLADIKPYLITKSETDLTNRAYEYICEWILSNRSRFIPTDYQPEESILAEVYGSSDNECTYIIPTIFRKAMRAEGFDSNSVLKSFKRAKLIKTGNDQKRNTYKYRVGGDPTWTVAVIMPQEQQEI